MDEPEEQTPQAPSKSGDRDRDADARDAHADQSDMNANLQAWLNDDDASGQAHHERRAAAQGRTTAQGERRSAAAQRSAEPADEVDIEVRIDDTWLPGYLYARDWRKNLGGHWQCFVYYVATDPTGRTASRTGYFNDNNIRQVSASGR